MEKTQLAGEGNQPEMSAEIAGLSQVIELGFTKVEANFESVKREIDNLHKKVETLIRKVDALEGNTNDSFEEVGLKLETLSEEKLKIGTVTEYDQQFGNLSAVG